MRHLTLGEVVALHRAILGATGGADGIRDLGALESALAQPKATFDGRTSIPHWWRKPVLWPLAWR
jgi:death-on-curing protein